MFRLYNYFDGNTLRLDPTDFPRLSFAVLFSVCRLLAAEQVLVLHFGFGLNLANYYNVGLVVLQSISLDLACQSDGYDKTAETDFVSI